MRQKIHDLIAPRTGTRYRATEALFIGRARAANIGDEVSAKSVEKCGWQDGVEEITETEIVAAQQVDPTTPNVPKRGASKADWVAYATDARLAGQALSSEEADVLTRDELADHFLGSD